MMSHFSDTSCLPEFSGRMIAYFRSTSIYFNHSRNFSKFLGMLTLRISQSLSEIMRIFGPNRSEDVTFVPNFLQCPMVAHITIQARAG